MDSRAFSERGWRVKSFREPTEKARMSDQPSDKNRIPHAVNPHALYLPHTPEWKKLATEFRIEGRKPIACIAIPGSSLSPPFNQFGVQILLRANYEGLMFGDKVLRLRVFRFEQPATIEMIMAVDVSNPAQPFIEWPVWAAAASSLVMVNIRRCNGSKKQKHLRQALHYYCNRPIGYGSAAQQKALSVVAARRA
jgi:hypothetical protein